MTSTGPGPKPGLVLTDKPPGEHADIKSKCSASNFGPSMHVKQHLIINTEIFLDTM
jgi:hypothetical protein